LITLGVFTFMVTWNDFMWPLVALIDSDLRTLPIALPVLSGEHVQDTELMMAGSVLTVLVLFVAVQRYYAAGSQPAASRNERYSRQGLAFRVATS
jgi:multiple sugar transport system permease protein